MRKPLRTASNTSQRPSRRKVQARNQLRRLLQAPRLDLRPDRTLAVHQLCPRRRVLLSLMLLAGVVRSDMELHRFETRMVKLRRRERAKDQRTFQSYELKTVTMIRTTVMMLAKMTTTTMEPWKSTMIWPIKMRSVQQLRS